MQNNKLGTDTSNNHHFIFGALIGTFTGILVFAHIGNYLLLQSTSDPGKYLNTIFVLLFVALAFGQIIKFFWKTKKSRKRLY